MSRDSIKNKKKFWLFGKKIQLEDLKMPELEYYDQKIWIYNEWKEQWKKDSESERKDRSLFYRLFCYDYIYTCNACERNKRNNFIMKILCIFPVVLVFFLHVALIALQIIAFLTNGKNFGFLIGKNMQQIVMIEVSSIVVVLFLILFISKWINVKKYQETWNRHSAHRYNIEIQMLRYISCMGEYAHQDKNEYFVKVVMDIWNKNQNKFNKNMKKEEQVGENVSEILTKIMTI